MPRFDAVFFDIGETIVDKSRDYAAMAAFLGVAPHTFSAVFGGLLARGADFREVVPLLRPDLSWSAARAAGAGRTDVIEDDLYSDVRPALGKLRESGIFVGVCGNQDPGLAENLRALGLPADLVATSAEWATAKPAPEFFARIAQECDLPSERIAYVGDQWDNDVRPAADAGMAAVRLRRGPWGALHADDASAAQCLAVIDGLDELPGLLAGGT
ncbi:HAD family hydrolase [Bounagaea algeriensis]